MKRIFSCLAVLGMVILSAVGGVMVSATGGLSDEELLEYSLNDIMFYSPCFDNNESGGVNILEGKNNKERVWNWFANAGIEGVSDNPVVIAGIMGNIGKESGYNPFAKNSAGYYGLYQEDSAKMREYVEGKIGTVNWGASTDDAEKNSAAIAAELEWLQNHDDFKQFVKDLNTPSSKSGTAGAKAYAELFLVRYERAVGGSDSIEDSGVYDYMKKMYNGTTYLYQNASGRRKEAEDVYNYAQDNGTFTSTSSTKSSDPACNACAQGSKNINGAAVCLAWPLDTNKSKYSWNGGTGTSLFNEVYPKLLSKGARSSYKGCDGPVYGASCDRFVSTVVRFSGYDKEFATGVGGWDYKRSQLNWANDHKDLWEVIKWDGSPSELKAGDVVLRPDHVAIAVQDEKGDFYIAEASFCGSYGHIRKIRKKENFDYIIRATGASNSTNGVSVTDGVKTSSVTGTMTSGTGQGNMDIGATARYFAWPEGTSSDDYKNRIKPEVEEVWKKLLSDNNISPNGHLHMGRSCVVFAWGVVRYAGLIGEYHISEHMDQYMMKDPDWEIVGDNIKASEVKDGDVFSWLKLNSSGNPGHYGIFARDPDGTLRTIEASLHAPHYGLVEEKKISDSETLNGFRVWRNKKNKSGGACNVCDDGNNGGGQLKAGGFDTVEEATAFMQSYIDAASPGGKYYDKSGDVLFGVKNGKIHDAGCPHGVLNNCVAFSQWFVNNYTTVGPNWNNTTNGADLVGALEKKGLKRGTEPRPYAIFSKNGPSKEGHTGVVLGVNTTTKKVIVGDAACNFSSRVFYKPRAYVLSFDDVKNYWYAYTDDVISMGGPLQNV